MPFTDLAPDTPSGRPPIDPRGRKASSSAARPSGSSNALSRRSFIGASAVAAASLALGSGLALTGCGRSATASRTRTVTDMVGRQVKAPETISRIFCTNPIGTADLYMLAPWTLVGWNFLPSGDNRKYIDEQFLELPALGVWMGSGSTPNVEEIAKQNPDVLLCFWTADDAGATMADDIAEETGLPVLVVDYDLRNVPAMFRYVGDLVDHETTAEELALFCEKKIALIKQIVATIPTSARKRIYLAQGNNGLTTDPVGSMHVTDALELVGTANVADMPGTEGQGMGMPSVNLEQIVSWNPDAVLVSEFSMSNAESSDIYDYVLSDSQWHNVPCVAAGEVFRIPQAPFSWFGRPPSAIRLLGCLWLLKKLYPDYAADLDLAAETREFYQRMYAIEDLSDETIAAMLL